MNSAGSAVRATRPPPDSSRSGHDKKEILMYQTGDFIVYGDTGICKITDISTMSATSKQSPALYYTLTPLFQNCVIHTPVHGAKVFMRPAITKEMANRIIDDIPSATITTYHSRSVNDLTHHYQSSFASHKCESLVDLTMSIFAKKQELEKQGRKPGATDEKYMKRAEELLFGELSVALGIPKDDVPAYISKRVSQLTASMSVSQ
jgi:CarD family transcriptional regulator